MPTSKIPELPASRLGWLLAQYGVAPQLSPGVDELFVEWAPVASASYPVAPWPRSTLDAFGSSCHASQESPNRRWCSVPGSWRRTQSLRPTPGTRSKLRQGGDGGRGGIEARLSSSTSCDPSSLAGRATTRFASRLKETSPHGTGRTGGTSSTFPSSSTGSTHVLHETLGYKRAGGSMRSAEL